MAPKRSALRETLRGEAEWHDGGWRAHLWQGKSITCNGPNRRAKKKAEQDVRQMLSAPGGIDGILTWKAQLMAEARADRAAAATDLAAEEERRTAASEKETVKLLSLVCLVTLTVTADAAFCSQRENIGKQYETYGN
jgi:hypothetical protein